MATKPATSLPALRGSSAKEKLETLEPSLTAKEILDVLPGQLNTFILNRVATSDQLAQPPMPGMGGGDNLRVSFLRLLQPNSRNKAYRGTDMPAGSVIGKTPLYIPKKKEMVGGFPFIVLTAWQERVQSKYDQASEQTTTYCQSADGVVPSMQNSWDTKKCKSCPRFPKNRPDYDVDPDPTERCKSIYNIIGVGGDFKDFYILTVKGKSIMPVYFRGFIPHLRTLTYDGLPYYSNTFMVGTAPSGPYFQYDIKSVIPTVKLEGYDDDPFFAADDPNSRDVTLQMLAHLQNIASTWVTEKQAAARANVQSFLEMTTPIPETDDNDDDEYEDDAKGLD